MTTTDSGDKRQNDPCNPPLRASAFASPLSGRIAYLPDASPLERGRVGQRWVFSSTHTVQLPVAGLKDFITFTRISSVFEAWRYDSNIVHSQ
ncbi:hypothetical protein BaRGS_00010595 [Batillaria attramentaria]|uniref:Uncharacterized protein n=1 Tax=Batillaria attramentaria TaxID=370345 RepID=A0ABD0LFW3_9CAEN